MQPAMIELQTPHGAVSLRPTREEDAEAYRELRLEGLRTHSEVFGEAYAASLERPPERWQRTVRDGAGSELSILYVAEAGGKLVGMAGIYRIDGAKMRHSGNIWGVYIRPEWRGAGLADALIGACVGWARELELRLVKLSVVTTNTQAICRYVRCGFSIYGVEPEVIYHNNVYYDELLMYRRL
jgi:RimJ/RimL family protein N-acetyltransferase